MPARFDHLVIAVDDLDEATARWTAAGIPASRGGAHPVGTVNTLVRGPRPAYLELIAAGSAESNPWLDRVRSGSGPISWAVAVDDVEEARAALVGAGFEPQPVTAGSRSTPGGGTVAWRMCDVGPGPYDASLPFLIQWTTPMPPGPADGPVVGNVQLTPSHPDRVADLLLALGFVGHEAWPRRVFSEAGGGGVRVTLQPVGEPVRRAGSAYLAFGDAECAGEPSTAVWLEQPVEEMVEHRLDDTTVWSVPDRRRFAGSALLPDVEEAFVRLRGGLADWPDPHPGGVSPRAEEYSRCLDPDRYRLLGARADAWVEAITSAGLGSARTVLVERITWSGSPRVRPARATVLEGRSGTLPVVVGWAPMDEVDDAVVMVGVGDPVRVLELQPDCGCDACDTGSADLLRTVDAAFLLALSGDVLAVREGDRVVTRSLDGWESSGSFAPGEEDRWLADAAAGRRADGVVRGEPWL